MRVGGRKDFFIPDSSAPSSEEQGATGVIAGNPRQKRIALHRHHPGETFNRDTGEYAVVEHRSC